MQPKRKRLHDRIVDVVEEWLVGYDFMVLKSYSVPIMQTNTAILLAFSEEERLERGQKRKRMEPVVKPDLLASHRKSGLYIAVEVALTSNPTEEADKLLLLKEQARLDLRLLIVIRSSHHDGWIGKIPMVSFRHLDGVLMQALSTGKTTELDRVIKKRAMT